MKSEFGLVGLGVMGKSLSRNLANNGVSLSLYNRHVDDVEVDVAKRFIAEHDELSQAQGFDDLGDFVASLASPRRVFLMVNAGAAVDAVISELKSLLDKGDVIIDGGNSHYKETERRSQELESVGIDYIGTGVSGGEEGALKGPSIMPGGTPSAYPKVSQYLEKIAARDRWGGGCCTYIGKGGAGHFVKMVHNGIEYAEMQLLAEVYSILIRRGQTADEIADILSEWTDTDISSYLLEITVDILRKKEGDVPLIDKILDQAGNKGTGSWTTIAAAELGVPIPTMTAALFARYISAFKTERVQAATLYPKGSSQAKSMDIESLKKGYQLARIINHHQGIHLIDAASVAYNWGLNFSELARIWTNGCIIRSELMHELIDVLKDQKRILLHPTMLNRVIDMHEALGDVVASAHKTQVAIPCFSAASDYLNAYITANGSANIIQAQRDYFGAHTYKRIDDPTGASHHTVWV